MRAIVLTALLVLAGCSTVRGLLGQAQEIGDKGIGVQATAGTEPSKAEIEARNRAQEMPELPTGLAGDTANRSHTPQD